MTVTRRTFEAVADAVREGWVDVFLNHEPSEDALQLHRAIVDRLTSHPDFGGSNPRFDVDRFVAATDGPKKLRVLANIEASKH